MNIGEHVKRHKELHKSLDELLADFINETGRDVGETILTDFIRWSYEQTIGNVNG